MYLNERGRRSRPVFVQNTLGQVFTQIFKERVAYMIQEVLILWAVLLMTVDEAFYQPDEKRYNIESLLEIQTAVLRRNISKSPYKHLRINSAACRRLLALLRAFIPRHPAWITMTIHTHTHANISIKITFMLSQGEHPQVSITIE